MPELVPVLWEEFYLEFDIKPLGINKEWTNVLHVTTKDAPATNLLGDRIPAIFLSESSANEVSFYGQTFILIKFHNGKHRSPAGRSLLNLLDKIGDSKS